MHPVVGLFLIMDKGQTVHLRVHYDAYVGVNRMHTTIIITAQCVKNSRTGGKPDCKDKIAKKSFTGTENTNRLSNLVQQFASYDEDQCHHNRRENDSVNVHHESGSAEQMEI